MPNANGGQRNDLDEQIFDQVRRGPRTQDELSREIGETESEIRSRLQFLDGAGYVEQNEETGEYEFRDHPEESHLFEERPRLRWVAFAAVFLLSGALYIYLFSVVLESVAPLTPPPGVEPGEGTGPSPSGVFGVAVLLSLPFAWITARIIIAPHFVGKGQAYDVYSWRS
jgi:hypothetical protein